MTKDTPAASAAKPKVKLTSLQRDMKRELGGDWVDIPHLPGASLCVRSLNYPPYKIGRATLLKRLGSKYGQDFSEARDRDMEAGFGQLYAEHILLGWRGFDEEYSAELAAQRLPAEEWAPLRELVEWAATKVASKNVEFVEGAAKN